MIARDSSMPVPPFAKNPYCGHHNRYGCYACLRVTLEARGVEWQEYSQEANKITQANFRRDNLEKVRTIQRSFAQEFRQANPAIIKERKRKAYLKMKEDPHAMEQRRQRARASRDRNKASIKERRNQPEYIAQQKARMKAWLEKNSDAGKKRYWKDPEKHRANALKDRARRQNVSVNDFTAVQWKTMKAHYKHRCVYCGKKPQRLTMDHITPISKGGSHTMHNIVPSCIHCNSRKRTGEAEKMIQTLLII
jgi:5-methylcytosine-specific restriction endonuclease McrA